MTAVLSEAPGEDRRSRELLMWLAEVWSWTTVAITDLSERMDFMKVDL